MEFWVPRKISPELDGNVGLRQRKTIEKNTNILVPQMHGHLGHESFTNIAVFILFWFKLRCQRQSCII